MEFTVGSAVRLGWVTFRMRPWFFMGVTVIILLVYAMVGILSAVVDVAGTMEEPSLFGAVLDFVLRIYVDMAVVTFYLAAHANPEAVELSALWQSRRPFWMFLTATVLIYVVIGFGLVLLIVPGIIALLLFMFTPFIVVDQGLGPIEAMKESMRITRKDLWRLSGLLVVQVLLALAGILTLGLGFLVAMPVGMLSLVHAYRVLLAKAGPPPLAEEKASLV